MSTRLSVLLVDDHALVRQGFRRLLEDDPLIEVVDEVGDGGSAVAAAARLRPDVIVMDYSMPGMSGIATTRTILAAWPAAAILMVSAHGDAGIVKQALGAGARGYVRKDALGLDLAGAVKRVAAGDVVIEPGGSIDATPSADGARPTLSPRQRQVLQLICDGASAEAIANQLNLSVNTVRVHRATIMKTLRVHRSTELVAYAIRHGLVTLP